MNGKFALERITRRALLRRAGRLAGGAAWLHSMPWLDAGAVSVIAGQAPAKTDPLAAMRADLAKAPIQTLSLGPNLSMLSGPGGNVVVLSGTEGKIVVDSFVQTVWPKLKQTIDGMDSTPVKLLIDTHWHFDHTDNNANFRAAGAAILAHENTRKRLSESHDLLGMHFEPSPPAALPTQTFARSHRLQVRGEIVELEYVPPAHTDTDIYVRYRKANVLHLGDLFFNGTYPFIDASTGGNIAGMIAAATRAGELADAQTKVVPGHGPLGDKAALTRYRDMLVTVRDRVEKLKKSGRTLADVIAQKPTADLDATWGKGLMTPDQFLTIVYNTL
jgi:glyoxylase-like metal-dependent hydrolase (beta-lactamase superfamily II)